jgi:hypothetical protein
MNNCDASRTESLICSNKNMIFDLKNNNLLASHRAAGKSLKDVGFDNVRIY